MATMPDLLASLRLKLDLPRNILESYERQAEEEYGCSLEELLVSRLTDCVDYTAAKPLYLDDDQRREIDKIFKKNVSDPNQLLAELRKSAALRVDKASVQLAPELLKRAQSRHLDKSKTFEQYLGQLIVKLLEQHVGMR